MERAVKRSRIIGFDVWNFSIEIRHQVRAAAQQGERLEAAAQRAALRREVDRDRAAARERFLLGR